MSGNKNSGFASFPEELRKQLAAEGGRSVNPSNRTFSSIPGLASRAGSLGGKASAEARRRKKAESEKNNVATRDS